MSDQNETDSWNLLQYQSIASQSGGSRLCMTSFVKATNIATLYHTEEQKAVTTASFLLVVEYQCHQVFLASASFLDTFSSETDPIERNFLTILWIIPLCYTVLSRYFCETLCHFFHEQYCIIWITVVQHCICTCLKDNQPC